MASFASSAFFFAAGGAFAAYGGKKFLRPPGSLPEDEFLARCTRCQKCVQACHTQVIVPLPLSSGIPAFGTPSVSYKTGYCDLCMKCTEVCPYGAIKPVAKEDVSIGIAVIVKKSCIAWDWVGCVDCVDKCPLKAIELDELKRPCVVREKCNGCGECELICPSSALRSSGGGGKGVIVVAWGEDEKYKN